MKLTEGGRNALKTEVAARMMSALRNHPELLEEAVLDGRIGINDATDDTLTSVATAYGVTIDQTWMSGAPFQLPVKETCGTLHAAHGGVVCDLVGASPSEQDYIVKAVNCHEDLVALLGSAALNEDFLESSDSVLIANARAALGIK